MASGLIRTDLDGDLGDAWSLSGAVSALGEPSFGDALFAAACRLARVDLMSAFCIDADGQPHYRLGRAAVSQRNEFANEAGLRYESAFWTLDPALRMLTKRGPGPSAATVVQQAWHEIPQSEYRCVCYEQPRLVDRLSVLGACADTQILLSVYRHARQGPFSAPEVLRFAGQAQVLAALLGKHIEITRRAVDAAPRGQEAPIEAQIALRFPLLSLRERQVCADLVAGLTAKEIARDRVIEPSSVVTYKKRAFAKLGVSSGRELLAAWRAHR